MYKYSSSSYFYFSFLNINFKPRKSNFKDCKQKKIRGEAKIAILSAQEEGIKMIIMCRTKRQTDMENILFKLMRKIRRETDSGAEKMEKLYNLTLFIVFEN